LFAFFCSAHSFFFLSYPYLFSTQVPSNILQDFYHSAESNTIANIETCGVLAGKFNNQTKSFHITHVILPTQSATADTCVTSEEESLIEVQTKYDLLSLGWIHTHPSQSCFLSSIDLHTHFSYQLMLPESIAIVLSPLHQPNSGIFNCTHDGMRALTNCSRSGFHQHNESFPLFGLASHYYWDSEPSRKAIIIDLRKKIQPNTQIQYQPQPLSHSHSHSNRIPTHSSSSSSSYNNRSFNNNSTMSSSNVSLSIPPPLWYTTSNQNQSDYSFISRR
jgi:proteasome lid subunit RPN8/RPN11